MPHAIVGSNRTVKGLTEVTINARSEGGQRLVFERWVDGYGRSTSKPRAQPQLFPEPKQRQEWSFGFEMRPNETGRSLFDWLQREQSKS